MDDNGKTLLAAYVDWLATGRDGSRPLVNGADLSDLDMPGADLSALCAIGANLRA